MANEIHENASIAALAKGLPRSSMQINGLHESDAELIRMPGSETILAVTTDSICEEIEVELYDDPFLIGWMTVIVNASDLAAVGAEPLGMVLSQTLPKDVDEDYLNRLQQGVSEASAVTGLPVLGGDTNFSDRLQMGACAFGTIPDGKPMQRIGCQCGDHLFASNFLGSGNGYAFAKFFSPELSAEIDYQPESRIKEGQILRRYASCCMDTSDGAIATLDQLMRLNEVGFHMDVPFEQYIDPPTIELCHRANLPDWITLAGFHGEFELLFTVPLDLVVTFLKEADAHGWTPIALGRVVDTPEVDMRCSDENITFDTEKIRNLFTEVNGDVNEYLKELLLIDKEVNSERERS
jgi:thiamine-monophosphate kinase